MQDAYPWLPGLSARSRALNLRVYEIASRSERRRFARLPWRAYRSDRRWVPPLLGERLAALEPARNPLLAGAELALFMAEAPARDLGDETLGTIVVWGDPGGDLAWFGALEAANEPEVVERLLEAAETWTSHHLPAASALAGPACLDARGAPGLLVDGFDRQPAAYLPYNLPYLPELVEATGYAPAARWQTCELTLSRLTDAETGVPAAEVTIRPADPGDWPAERARLAEVFEAACTDADLRSDFIPGPAVVAETDGWRPDPRTVFFAEAGGEVVAAVAGVPDPSPALRLAKGRWFPFGRLAHSLARRRMSRLRLLPPAMLPEWQDRGIEAALCRAVAAAASCLGYGQAVFGPLPADAVEVIDALTALGAQKAQAFQLYEKTLGLEEW